MRLAQGHKSITIPSVGLLVVIFLFNAFFNDISLRILLLLSSLVFIFILFFFRDPERQVPDVSGILAPADGKIIEITEHAGLSSINIMMSLFDVHVTRMPFTGRILSIERKSGSHFPMLPFYTKRSRENARQIIKIEADEFCIETIQISGFLARRCVCYHKPGAVVPRGDRLGIVRFGSEVDTHFPSDRFRVVVQVGQAVRAGETLIAVKRENDIQISK